MWRAACRVFALALLVAAAPSLAEQGPVNAPIASFLRHNAGWSVTVSFADPVTAIAWRLGDDGAFRETGFLDVLDPRTHRRMANPNFELDPDTPASVIAVRAIDLDGKSIGPFPIAFDPSAELERGQRGILELTASSWVSFRRYNGLLLYYTQLMSYRSAIREVRVGIDTTMPKQIIALPPCDPVHPEEIPADAKPYLSLPTTTQLVSVELTYR